MFLNKKINIATLVLSMIAATAHAQSVPGEPAAVPEPPEIPLPVQSGEEMQPDITIIRKGKDTIQEYRRNGKLYMVKVEPAVGPAYYMYDTNGDEKMDVTKNDMDKTSNVNMWKLFEWDW